MMLAIVNDWFVIVCELVGCFILGILLYYIRKYHHNRILRKINKNNYEETFFKLEKMTNYPFLFIPSLEKETIYLEMAMLQLLIKDYDKFNYYIDKIKNKKIHFVKIVCKSLYFYQIGNQEEFKKNKNFTENIYSKFSKKYTTAYKFYIDLLNTLDSTVINYKGLEQLMTKISKPFGMLIKEYILKIINETYRNSKIVN